MDNQWWDAFVTEFFEDDATLTLAFCLEDGPKRYSKREIVFKQLLSKSFFSLFFIQQPLAEH
jgi:LIM domain-binding protein 2